MPTVILLAIAYQIQNVKFRYFFFVLAVANLVFNIFHDFWVQEIYSVVIVLLLYTLNPLFLNWWEKRNDRNNPSSFWELISDTYQVAKYNKLKILFWTVLWIGSMVAIYFYKIYTEYTLLVWILALFISIYIFKQLFYSMLSPEWFLHDINTGYVFLGVVSAWIVSSIMYQHLGAEFIVPMALTAIICLIGIYFIRDSSRFIVPGCAVIFADLIWQVIRYFQANTSLLPQFLLTEVILMVAMLIGLAWLTKKPSILPIIYLIIFQLFRFTAFVYQGIDSALGQYSTPEVTYYILYLVCWMLVVPLIFLFKGVIQVPGNALSLNRSPRRRHSEEALLAGATE